LADSYRKSDLATALRTPRFLVETVLMNQPEDEGAWLETNGERNVLHGTCSVGRAAANTLVLDLPKVSRMHALIQLQNIGEFWLVDLGSSNGTFLNKRRVHQPVQLHDQDKIVIGGRQFIFRQPNEISPQYQTTIAQRTLQEIENVPCWLLVADIVEFTPLSRSLVSERLAALVGGWFATCKKIIEEHDGTINKYLGDGILAYWHETDATPEGIAATIEALKKTQALAEPRFRFIVHFGLVAIGGVASLGEESLMGVEVNVAFRLEKLAASLGEACGLSEAASSKVEGFISSRRLGDYELKGFAGKRAFFAS
jgi:adenylate cyclase